MTVSRVIITYVLTISYCLILNHNVSGTDVANEPTSSNTSNLSTILRPPTTEKVLFAEGGIVGNRSNASLDTTHNGREHMLKVTPARTVNLPSSSTTSTAAPLDKHMVSVAPLNHTVPKNSSSHVPPFETAEKNDNKQSVPKKGVDVPPPRKPTITESSDDDHRDAKSSEKIGDLSLDKFSQEKSKKTDYVVPIVAVILSVPLVAIIISVLYKRGAEWWQHRHYRRMDFLIDGMYNN